MRCSDLGVSGWFDVLHDLLGLPVGGEPLECTHHGSVGGRRGHEDLAAGRDLVGNPWNGSARGAEGTCHMSNHCLSWEGRT